MQLEDVIDFLQVAFPDHEISVLFDQSSGHTAKQEDRIHAGNMNTKFGGQMINIRSVQLIETKLLDSLIVSRMLAIYNSVTFQRVQTAMKMMPPNNDKRKRLEKRDNMILPEFTTQDRG